LSEALKVGHRLPLKLTQIFLHSAPYEPRFAGPVKRKERLAVLKEHHVLATPFTANEQKRIFVVFEMRAVKTEQTPVRLTT
jgi:hypothetical protein